MKEIRALATSMLGYGVPVDSFMKGLEKNPDFIGSDMGSTDFGPYFLGSGNTATNDEILKKDLELVIINGLKKNIPVIMGSAGSAGSDVHLDKVLAIIKKIVKEKRLNFKMGIIRNEVNKEILKEKLLNNKISAFRHNPQLTIEEIEKSKHIVAQIGPEPFIELLKKRVQVIVSGRSCDTSIFAALPIFKNFNRGLVMHMSKIIECASQCAEPGGRDAIMGYLKKDHFLLESQNFKRRCTPLSVAAHTLYEQTNPYYISEPGGTIDVTNSKYEVYNSRITKISGSKWLPSEKYILKIEGSSKVGYRTFSFGGVRDKILIKQITSVSNEVKDIVKNLLSEYTIGEDYNLFFRIYGKNGILGLKEPNLEFIPQEAFVIIDVVGKTPNISKSVCTIARQNFLHYFYDGIIATGGNIAFPFSPLECYLGEVYRFNIYHLVEMDNPLEFSNIEVMNF